MKSKFQMPSLTRITLTIALPLSTLISIACQKQFLKEHTNDNRAATLAAALSASDKQKVSGTIDQASGRLTAAMSSSALVTQEVSPNGDSNLAGVLLKFPPGSLAIDTNISLQESVPIATSSAAASLGLRGSVTAVGLPLAVQPSILVDPAQPFIIALQLPPGAGLRLASGLDNLVVMYKANVYATKQVLSGILPRSALTIEGDSVRFPSRYFGAFQIAYTETLVEQAKEVETATPVQTKYEVAALPALSITSRSPYVVRAAETVTLTGKNFRPSMILALGGKLVSQLKVLSDVSASFIVPTAMAAGGLTLTAEQDGVSQSISLLFTPGDSSTPVITLAPSEVCAGLKYYDAAGNLQVGIKPCPAPLPDCAADGATGCAANAAYKAAAMAGLSSKVLSGSTVAGVVGTAIPEYRPDCAADGATGCVTVPAYKAADMTRAIAGNIKSGVTIAGAIGAYPSATYPLLGANATPDLDLPTFDAKIKSASNFQWFSSDGTRYQNAGDADITPANISNGVTIFGATGTLQGAGNIDPWNVRTGVTIAGVAGALKTNCRNTVNSAYFNFDGAVGSIGTAGVTTGTAFDYWDTVDDYFGFSSSKVTAWSSDTVCDSSVWEDVTTTNGGSSTTTCASGTCIYKDKISNLQVTGILAAGGNTSTTATPGTFAWNVALSTCNSSTYGGYAAGTWRLPTQKELMSMYEHGIASLHSPDFMSLANMRNYFWSSSTYSPNTPGQAWGVILAYGNTTNYGSTKTNAHSVVCVR
jgi:hypothetical protein